MLLQNTQSNFQEERNDREQLNSMKKILIVAIAPTWDSRSSADLHIMHSLAHTSMVLMAHIVQQELNCSWVLHKIIEEDTNGQSQLTSTLLK